MTFGEDKDIEDIIYLNINQTQKLLKHLKDSFNKEEGLLVRDKNSKEGFLKEIMYEELKDKYFDEKQSKELLMVIANTDKVYKPKYFFSNDPDYRTKNILRLVILDKEAGYTSVRGEFLLDVHELQIDFKRR
jgi:hypothetical protein